MARGIYTLADDAVVDCLVALLDSLQANTAADLPICVIPYSDAVERVAAVVAERRGVQLFRDHAAIERWEAFAWQVWSSHPRAMQLWEQRYGERRLHRGSLHRKLCCLDGPFDEFLFLDADILILDAVTPYFDALRSGDFVAYDDQYRGPSHVFQMDSLRLGEAFAGVDPTSQMFCAGLFASRRAVFSPEEVAALRERLRGGDADVLYPWAPEQSLLNYMIHRGGRSVFNLYRTPGPDQRTATCVTYPEFEVRDHLLWDGGARVPFLHYIGIPPQIFSRLASGENVDFPYRDLFLHYRFLRDPDSRPALRGRLVPYYRPPRWPVRQWRRLRARLRDATR